MSDPYLLTATQGEALWFLDNLVTLKATAHQTRGRVTVASFLNPPGFAPPLHRHTVEDEMFLILSGHVDFFCGNTVLAAGPGDFVFLPVGAPHSFRVARDEPLEALQITTPGGFEDFARMAGKPAGRRALPEPRPLDPVALGHAAATHNIEILGPPPAATS